MIEKVWRDSMNVGWVDVPDGAPEHMVSELVTVIEMIDGYPTKEQVVAMKRIARAIREEKRD